MGYLCHEFEGILLDAFQDHFMHFSLQCIYIVDIHFILFGLVLVAANSASIYIHVFCILLLLRPNLIYQCMSVSVLYITQMHKLQCILAYWF